MVYGVCESRREGAWPHASQLQLRQQSPVREDRLHVGRCVARAPRERSEVPLLQRPVFRPLNPRLMHDLRVPLRRSHWSTRPIAQVGRGRERDPVPVADEGWAAEAGKTETTRASALWNARARTPPKCERRLPRSSKSYPATREGQRRLLRVRTRRTAGRLNSSTVGSSIRLLYHDDTSHRRGIWRARRGAEQSEEPKPEGADRPGERGAGMLGGGGSASRMSSSGPSGGGGGGGACMGSGAEGGGLQRSRNAMLAGYTNAKRRETEWRKLECALGGGHLGGSCSNEATSPTPACGLMLVVAAPCGAGGCACG